MLKIVLRQVCLAICLFMVSYSAFPQYGSGSVDSLKNAFKSKYRRNLASSVGNVSATGKDPFVPNLIPPSPNAASLGKYTDFPVSQYTGLPSISIPIYELKSRSLSVPISLSYHAGGHKVGEVASWVGLGWSLNAGGLITRTVRGLPDEATDVGFFATRLDYPNPDHISFAGVDPNIWKNDIVGAVKNQIDFEQDIYMLNAMGRSYKLLFKSDGTILTIPKSDLKISVNHTTETWTILLEDGTKLTFGGDGATEISEGASSDVTSYGSSWYLKNISSQQGDQINFSYTLSSIKNDMGYSESDGVDLNNTMTFGLQLIPAQSVDGVIKPAYYQVNLSNIVAGPTVQHSVKKVTFNEKDIAVLHLSSITSELGTVTFTKDAQQRQDLPGSYALTNISVFPKGSSVSSEEYELSYVYSNAVSSYDYSPTYKPEFLKRLKLNRIDRKVGNTLSQPWIFEYNPNKLPSRRSFAQDHFGYFNGAVANTTILPSSTIVLPNGTGFFPPYHELGGNREPNEAAMQAEILSSVQYPTGGKTNFTFEANKYTSLVDREVASSESLNITGNPNDNGNFSKSVQFTITKSQNINIQFGGSFSNTVLGDIGDNVPLAGLSIKDLSGNTLFSKGITKSQLQGGGFNFSDFAPLEAPNNSSKVYVMSINSPVTSFNPSDFFINSDIDFKVITTEVGDKLAGGLRIKKMTTEDGLGQIASEHFYQYSDPLILYNPNLADYIAKTINMADPFRPSEIMTRKSSSKYVLGSIQGGTIGYGTVTSLTNVSGNNGKSVSKFSNVDDEGTSISQILPYPPVDSRDHRRGLLLKQTDFRANNTKIKEVEHFYDFPFVQSITGVAANYYENWGGAGCNDPFAYCGINYSPYLITTEQVNKIKTIERNYDDGGVTNIETTSEYFYENSAYTQMTKTISTEGKSNKISVGGILKDSRIIETSMKYAYDFTDNSTLVGMTTSHIFSPIIEKTTKLIVTNTSGAITEKQLNFEKTTFDKYGNIYLPQKIETQHGSGSLQTAIIFDSYDASGNLLGYTQRNGLSNTFTYYGASDNGKTNLVRTQANNKGHTTTYDYKPLVGLQTVTDPNGRKTTFTYDNLNRLSNIKDQDDNFVKSYSYNYAPLRVSDDGTIGGVLRPSNDCVLGTTRIERNDKTSTSGKYMDNPCLEVILNPGFDTERKQYEARIGNR